MTPSELASALHPALTGGTAYTGLAGGLRTLILDGRLVVGAKLPSERDLAATVGLSRTTVTAGYDLLRADGYLASRRGDGTRVTLPPDRPARPDEGPAAPPIAIDLTVAALPAPAGIVAAAERAVERLPALLSGLGLHPLGLPELREAVARHLTGRGLVTTPEQVLITNGALHGWDLLLRTLLEPGDTVLVEQPTYPAILDAVRTHRGRLALLPVSADGWDLTGVAGQRPSRLAHVTPDFQNPTGFLATDAQRRALLRALPPQTVVVSDETTAELKHDPGEASPLPLAALGRRGQVVTVGSASKAYWAGLRIGWVRAEVPLVRRLAGARGGQDLAGPVLEQLVAAQLLADAETLLASRRGLLAGRRAAAVELLAGVAPHWELREPAGGVVLWAHLPEGASTTRLAGLATDRGIRITPGTRFSATGTHDRWLRIPFTPPPDVLARAVPLLAQLAAGRGSGTDPGVRWTV